MCFEMMQQGDAVPGLSPVWGLANRGMGQAHQASGIRSKKNPTASKKRVGFHGMKMK